MIHIRQEFNRILRDSGKSSWPKNNHAENYFIIAIYKFYKPGATYMQCMMDSHIKSRLIECQRLCINQKNEDFFMVIERHFSHWIYRTEFEKSFTNKKSY